RTGMNSPNTTQDITAPQSSAKYPDITDKPKIHPIIIYPYSQPSSYDDLISLYEFVTDLKKEPEKYAHPLTVMNRQTFYNNARYKFDDGWNEKFLNFREKIVEQNSRIVDAWSVDTCQMWLAGLGEAYDAKRTGEDVYWLIPGDFDYGTYR